MIKLEEEEEEPLIVIDSDEEQEENQSQPNIHTQQSQVKFSTKDEHLQLKS